MLGVVVDHTDMLVWLRWPVNFGGTTGRHAEFGSRNVGMARNPRESRDATLWQLRLLATVIEAGSWEGAAERLGIDKFQAAKAIDRLREKLHLANLLPPIGHTDFTESDLEFGRKARNVLDAYDQFLSLADQHREGADLVVRVSAFPAHISHFLAKSMNRVAAARSGLRFEIDDVYGDARKWAGTGLLQLLGSGAYDFVVAPVDSGRSSDDPHRRWLYRWNLVAAIRSGHPLLREAHEDPEGPVMDVQRLRGWQLLTAPEGHLSRSLIGVHLRAASVPIAMTSSHPDVLVALGGDSDLVPIIPSDSRVAYESHWPRLTADDEPLGGAYFACWSTGQRNHPDLSNVLSHLAEEVFKASAHLRDLPGGGRS